MTPTNYTREDRKELTALLANMQRRQTYQVRIQVGVHKTDIKSGQQCKASTCPWALAITRTLTRLIPEGFAEMRSNPSVSIHSGTFRAIYVRDGKEYDWYFVFALPRTVRAWISDYDSDGGRQRALPLTTAIDMRVSAHIYPVRPVYA